MGVVLVVDVEGSWKTRIDWVVVGGLTEVEGSLKMCVL